MSKTREWMAAGLSLLVVTIFLQLSHGGLRDRVVAGTQGGAFHVIQSTGPLRASGWEPH
jgi:hypothetical protein